MAIETGTRRGIQLWWTSVSRADDHLDQLSEIFDADEQLRAGRFKVEAGRRRFVAAHIMLRVVLGRTVGAPPGQLRFRAGARGKPSLAAPDAGPTPRFNLSHSGDVAVVAIADAELGVDVEAHRPVTNAERLATRFFSEGERRWLSLQSEGRRDAAFLSIWTCKEAYLKAIGSGIAMQLCALEIDPDRPAIARISNDPHAAAAWSILRADLPIAAECAVAIRGHRWELDVREFDWENA